MPSLKIKNMQKERGVVMRVSLCDTKTHRAQEIILLCCAGGTHILIKSLIPLDLLQEIFLIGSFIIDICLFE